MENRINITNEANEGLVEIFGKIGYDWWTDNDSNTAQSINDQLKALEECEKVKVKIHSLGGNVDDAFAIYDMLKGMKQVETECVGMCASAATIIFMAGNVRKMNKNAMFLIHKCSSAVMGNENALEAELETQRLINERIVEIYTTGTGKDKAEIEELMEANDGEGKWINAEECLSRGFSTETVSGRKAQKSAVFAMADFEDAGLPMPENMTVEAGIMARVKDFVQELFNQQKNDKMKEEEFKAMQEERDALKQQVAEVEAKVAEAEAKAAEAENKMKEAEAKAEEAAAKQAEAEAKQAELQAIIDATPKPAVNAPDPKDNEWSNYVANSEYMQEAKKRLGR